MDDPQARKHEEHRRQEVHAVLSFVIALGVVIAGGAIGAVLVMTRPQPEHRNEVKPAPTVEAVALERGDHTVVIPTQGVVQSRREVKLAAQVGGRVEGIAPDLVEGGRVGLGDRLAWIEKADFEAALARTKAALEDAELALEIEKAKAVQAERDWEKLGRGEAPALVLRVPQIESAEARIESAREEVERAERDLERTTIRAPFSGRVRMAGVETGAVVAPGTVVAEIYSDDDLEVRLPFPLEDFGFLRELGTPPFKVTARLGGRTHEWPAELVRIDGEVDRATLSGYGIAKVAADVEGNFPPVGLFVQAKVLGETLSDVVEVPRAAVRQEGEVWVAVPDPDSEASKDEELESGILKKRMVEVLRSMRRTLIVRMDFEPDDRLVLTRLNTSAEGDRVRIATNGEAIE